MIEPEDRDVAGGLAGKASCPGEMTKDGRRVVATVALLDREMIRQTLVELMEADIGEKFTDLQDSKKLREELGLDSVDVVSVVSQIERHFRIRLSQQDLEKLVSVGDLLDLLVMKLSVPPTSAAA